MPPQKFQKSTINFYDFMYILHVAPLNFDRSSIKFQNFMYILYMPPQDFLFLFFCGPPNKNFLDPPLTLALIYLIG